MRWRKEAVVAKRKWRPSAFACLDIGQVIDSCTAFGGVWRADVGRFANRAWVMSQQLHYLLERTRLGVYYYPEPCENWKETTKEKNK